MAAISKAWVTIGDAAVDPDSPGDSTLLTGIRDNLIHLREWLGASFTGGAIQDHNHDGSNSALIEIGPNLVRNGSYEDSGTAWTITDYTGGSHAFSTSVRHHGDTSLAFTSTVLANGGGDAVSNEFIPVGEDRTYRIDFFASASVGNISARAQVIWYDAAQSQISADNIYDLTNTPTSRTHYSAPMTSPANARFAKIKLIGGVPGAGAATGTIYFDGVSFTEPAPGLAKLTQGTVSSAANLDILLTSYAKYKNFKIKLNSFVPATTTVILYGRVSTDGGATFDTGSSQYFYQSIAGSQSTSAVHTAGTDANMVFTGNVTTSTGAVVELEVCHANVANHPRFFHRTVYRDPSPNMVSIIGAFSRLAAQDTDAIRFLFSSGNIASGSWELYGYI